MNKKERMYGNKLAQKHGLYKTRLYNIWHSMYCRCYYSSTNGYKNYGGKGIKVCEEWKNDFMNFYTWAIENGYKENLTIDRLDNSKNYCPENCRWASVKEQSNNRTNNRIIEYKGQKKTLSQWCEEYKINIVTISDRLKNEMSFEEALTKPINKCGGHLLFTLNGETKLLSEWCKIYNINYQTAWKKLKNGNSIEYALKIK